MRLELVRADKAIGIDGTQITILAKKRCVRRNVYVLLGDGYVVFVALSSGNAATIFEGFESFKSGDGAHRYPQSGARPAPRALQRARAALLHRRA